MKFSLFGCLLIFLYATKVSGFSSFSGTLRQHIVLFGNLLEGECEPATVTRRRAVGRAIGGSVLTAGFVITGTAYAEDGYRPAKRPTAYRVDSTQPPTLVPLSSARKENKILTDLGRGMGTDKEAIVEDKVNLNNILNKAVFGAIDVVAGLGGSNKESSSDGPGSASFVCLGVPKVTTSTDIDLAVSLLTPIIAARKFETALGLAFCPLSAQSSLDSYVNGGDENAVLSALSQKGVADEIIQTNIPLIRLAKAKSLKLLALSPEKADIETARTQGLQNVDPERRNVYVADPKGFISLSQDPRFRLYTDRSLLKDFTPVASDDKPGDFFAERILVHETAATIAAKYATERPNSLVAVVAPIPDLRFLLGINGRIPRLYRFFNPELNKVSENSVTTILLNPTAKETLSKSRFLRLEIGTGPDTLDYQTKVADYLWFSSSPKVNLIPRLMNG